MNGAVSIDVDNLPGYLAENFPELARQIEAELQHGDPAWSLARTLVRDVFVYGVFRRAVDAGNDEILDLCYSMTEVLISAKDEELRSVVLDCVLSAVCSTDDWLRVTQMKAGPVLRREIGLDLGESWRRQMSRGGGDMPLPRSAAIQVHEYAGSIFMHALVSTPDGSVIAPPFVRLSAASSWSAVGIAASNLLLEQIESQPRESRHHVDEFLRIVGETDWRGFYTRSRSVDVVTSEIGADARIWPRHKHQDGDYFGNRQGERLTVTDWREPDVLGRAILTAIAIASTTGWNSPT